MSVFKRGNGWSSKFVKDGQQIWVGSFDTKAQAIQAEKERRQNLALGRVAMPAETCAGWGDRWIREFPRPGVETQAQYERAVQVFSDHFGDRLLESIHKLEARAWSVNQSRGVHRVIVTMLNEAVEFGVLAANPFAGLRIHQVERVERIDPPTLVDYGAYLEACTVLGAYGGSMRRMIQLSAWTGMRQGELFALRWEDVDADRELIHVRQARKRGGTVGPTKNGRERTILYPPPAQVLHEEAPRPGSPFVFHSPTGKPLLRGTFAWSWQRVRSAAQIGGVSVDEIRKGQGMDPIRWHDWRHFCASQAMDRGVSIVDVAQQLGHMDNGIMVAKRYGHPNEQMARDRLRMAFGATDSIGSRGAERGMASGF